VAGRGLHRFALLTSVSTLFLIFVGGLVTSTGSGLAVPDWPLSYGQFFPKMVGGVFFEHGHRMVAATVGLLMTILAIWIFAKERRHWVGWLAAGALLTVVAQVILGGITVLLLLPTVVSVSHACLAQAFFCLTVTLAVVTGPGWKQPPVGSAPAPRAVRLPAALLTGAVYIQLILGAVMRHTGAGLAIPDFPLAFGRLVPPLDSAPVAIHFVHRVWALVVAGLAVWTVVRVLRSASVWLTRPAAVLSVLVVAQISLGAATVLSRKAVAITTAHVACGAAILAVSLVIALRAHRLAWSPPRGRRVPERAVPAGGLTGGVTT